MKKFDLVKKLFLVLIASFVPILPQAEFLEAVPVMPQYCSDNRKLPVEIAEEQGAGSACESRKPLSHLPTPGSPSAFTPKFCYPLQYWVISQNHNLRIVKVIIEGNTVFSDAELEAIISDFVGKPITLENVQLLAKAIAEFYVANGYTTSDAYSFPHQNLLDGEVRILVVEGILEAVEIKGLHSVGENYVRERLNVGKVLNTEQLVEQLQLLQLNPLFASVEAQLKQGSQPQSSILSMKIVENPNFNLTFGIDNYGAFNSGEIEGDANFTINSLTGNGDRLSTQLIISEGSRQIIADYQFPLNRDNEIFRLHYEGGNSKIIKKPLKRFDIEGNYQKAFVQWRRPVVKTVTDELALVVEAGWQQSQSFLEDEPFSFFSDVPDSGYHSYTLRLAGEYFQSLPDRALAARGELTLGLDSLDRTSDPYVIFRAQAQYLKKLNEAWLFSFTFSGQVTGSSLGGAEFGILPSEQFPIGGINTVPGYDLNFRRGDNGVNVRGELFYTFLNQPDGGRMELVPFFAVGKVWNEQGIILKPQNLASVGLSWNWQWNDWQTRLGVAIPLVVDNVASLFRQEFYFSLQKRFSF